MTTLEIILLVFIYLFGYSFTYYKMFGKNKELAEISIFNYTVAIVLFFFWYLIFASVLFRAILLVFDSDWDDIMKM